MPHKDESSEFFSACLRNSTLLLADDFTSTYRRVQAWAASRSDHYSEHALRVFARYEVADAWLVAVAHERNLTVLTAEISDLQSGKRVKIPDACEGMAVKSCGFLNFLEATGYRG